MINLNIKELRRLYYYLSLTRKFDEKVCQLYRDGNLPEKPLSGIGQEATAVGATCALEESDFVLPSLRTRGAFLTKGLTMEEILIESCRKKGSKSEGRWTAHHMADLKKGILLGSGVIGSSVLMAVGAALSSKIKGSDQVVMVFFGDGASSRGDLHEALNFSAVMNLPVVFICENNSWALSTPIKKQMKNENIADRAKGYGIPGQVVDGQNIVEVYNAAKHAVMQARAGSGPTLIECKTYHFRGHSESHDPDDGRPKDELEHWRDRCPVKIFKEILREDGRISENKIESIGRDIEDKIEKAVEKVKKIPEINFTINDLLKFVYV